MGLDIYFYKAKIADAENYKEKYDSCKDKLNELARVDWEEKPEAEKEYEELISELDAINPWKEVAYFRKVNFLWGFFEYDESCKRINEDEVDLLIETCSDLLDKKAEVEAILDELADMEEDSASAKYELVKVEKEAARAKCELEKLAEETLPTTEGFCFGSYDYDEEYFDLVGCVLDKFKEINKNMDWENEILTMDCSW